MTDYYLMPTKWQGFKIEAALPEHPEWIKLVNCSAKQSRKAADDYERELNNGELYNVEKVAKEKAIMFQVIPIPYAQARDYNSFANWPCNCEDILADFHAWLADLDGNTAEEINMLPDIINKLPSFTSTWTVQQLWSAIRDR